MSPDGHFREGVADVSVLGYPVDRFPVEFDLGQRNPDLTEDQLPGAASVHVRLVQDGMVNLNKKRNVFLIIV